MYHIILIINDLWTKNIQKKKKIVFINCIFYYKLTEKLLQINKKYEIKLILVSLFSFKLN